MREKGAWLLGTRHITEYIETCGWAITVWKGGKQAWGILRHPVQGVQEKFGKIIHKHAIAPRGEWRKEKGIETAGPEVWRCYRNKRDRSLTANLGQSTFICAVTIMRKKRDGIFKNLFRQAQQLLVDKKGGKPDTTKKNLEPSCQRQTQCTNKINPT